MPISDTDLDSVLLCVVQPLALAHTEVDDKGVVQLSPWTEEDFRTGSKPWWT